MMKHHYVFKFGFILSVGLCLVSCQPAEKSVDRVQFDEQAEKLAVLQTELTEIRARAKEVGVAGEPQKVPVVELQKQLGAAKADLVDLDAKFKGLEKSHAELVKKLEEFQVKYPLR